MAYEMVGYTYILKKLNLNCYNYYQLTYIYSGSIKKSIVHNNSNTLLFPKKYWPGDTLFDHIEFAFRYDYLNLSLLFKILKSINKDDITSYISNKKNSIPARKIWFLYEFFFNEKLSLPDLKTGNYTDLLDTNRYITKKEATNCKRYRIRNNLLGSAKFSPIVRNSEKLKTLNSNTIKKRCEEVSSQYDKSVLRRALAYLYNKETKSSFKIENIDVDTTRTQRFVSLLTQAEVKDFSSKEGLIELQNRIVDSRFRDNDYRTSQNYVGQSISITDELIHYISPKPENITDLMEGLLDTHRELVKSSVSEIIHAAIISYGFVFLHPFEDGNGRIHRFIIHNILSIRGLIPKGLMFPISAVMLKHMDLYNISLESFSKSILPQIDYTLEKDGKMVVNNETDYLYRFIDMTTQVEFLYQFIEETIDSELVKELQFLTNYDSCRRYIQNIVDMPDRLITLIIKFLMQNDYILSKKKRVKYFEFLTDTEIVEIERITRGFFENPLSQSNL